MKLKFKNQQYQEDATKAVVDVFQGQTKIKVESITMHRNEGYLGDMGNIDVVYNPRLHITDDVVTSNIKKIQEANLIPSSDFSNLNNFSIEMETGTGKTYTYINTMYELYNTYGFSKFIIVVPSVAIREGVAKSFAVTEDHFQEKFGTKIRHYIYNSSTPQNISDFSGGTGIQCLIMNYQAFNAKSKDARKIYQERDEFGSNRPIDLLKACNPIMIIDEPQKISDNTEAKIEEEFKPLFVLRYSATHKKGKDYNKLYALNAIDAYNQKLVKKIEVVGLELVNDKSEGTYLYVSEIEATKTGPVAHLEMEQKTASGVKKIMRKTKVNDNLYAYSNELQAYK
ncbi:MAG: DEAD/DEAH box helicase family protein, partial [Bacilli bacterium]